MAQVLVTGATGFVAGYLVKDLLANGYKVVGTVRSTQDLSKLEHLLSLPNTKENLKLVEADLLKEGSFDEAVKGCAAIFHTASPFFYANASTDIKKELLEPAQLGTRNVLRAAEKARDTVKRVIVTASCATIIDFAKLVHGKVYTEDDWNETSTETSDPYSLSKVLAEKEAWKITKELQEKYGKENTFDLVVVNPPLITGPVMAVKRVKSVGAKELNTSCSVIRNFLLLKKTAPAQAKVSTTAGFPDVDVRDVARVHRLAFEVKEAGDNRIICAPADNTLQFAEACIWLKEAFPELADGIPDEFTGDVAEDKKKIGQIRTTKVQELLKAGEFISIKQSVLDTAKSLIDNDLVTGIH